MTACWRRWTAPSHTRKAHHVYPQFFKLPDVGEGLTEAEIVSWKVKLGDVVAVNDVIVEIETAKSIVELPSPYAGMVAQLMVAEGDTVDVGTPIIAIGSEVSAPAAAAPAARSCPAARGGGHEAAGGLRTQGRRRQAPPPGWLGPRRGRPLWPRCPPPPQRRHPPRLRRRAFPRPWQPGPTACWPSRPCARQPRIWASTSPRCQPTGLRGEVTKKDLLSYQDQRTAEQDGAGTFWAPATGTGLADDPRIERIKVKGVRKATAKAMVESAFSAPHVSIFVDVDASRTMEFVKRLKVSRDFEGIKVSPLLILAKAVIWAAARNPSVNATWTGDEIIIKHFMNLGIAAATPRGLMVPNIKDAQNLSLKELAIALNSAGHHGAGRQDAAGGHAGRLADSDQHWRPGHRHGHAHHQPGRSGDRGVRHHQAKAVGAGRGSHSALDHHPGRILRPPCG